MPVAQLGVEELFDDARVVCRTFGWATSKTEVAAFDLTAEQPRTYVLNDKRVVTNKQLVSRRCHCLHLDCSTSALRGFLFSIRFVVVVVVLGYIIRTGPTASGWAKQILPLVRR